MPIAKVVGMGCGVPSTANQTAGSYGATDGGVFAGRAVSSSPRVLSHADWSLRATLSGALVALLVAAWSLSATGSPPRTLGAPRAATGQRSVSIGTTTSTPAGATTGTVTRVQVSPGCGFSRSAGASPAPVGHCTVLEIGDSLA